MQPDDLERLVDRELRALPDPRAPRTLLPSILAAIDAGVHPAPWYARPWRTWPAVAQLAFAAAGVALVALVAGALAPGLREIAGTTATTGSISDSVALAGRVESITTAAWVLWRVLLQPLVPYAFALAMLMCCACVVFGMALNYVVFGRTLH